MIYCCGCYHKDTRIEFLKPNALFRDRKLEILICPKCGTLIAELTQFDIEKNAYINIRPKRKKTAKFLMQLEAENEVIKMPEIKYGTKSNSNWAYGENKELSDGSVRQYRKDFNGYSTLVKVIQAREEKELA